MEIELDARSFIEQQFAIHGIFHRTLKHDFAIDCPFRPSSSGKQKMMVAFDGSKFHCWSCGASGNYNTLAERMGLQKLPRSATLAFRPIEESIETLTRTQPKPSLPGALEDFRAEYRGLSADFLARFSSKRWYDPASRIHRILWPVSQNGRLRGWVAGRLDNETTPKYRNGPEGVFRARNALWPIDDPEVKRNVVLVEGPYSALRLLNAGIPAVSILGTGAWSPAKLAVLEQRKRPVRGLIIAMDGDDEGWSCAKKIYQAARDRFEVCEVFQFPDGRDPGDCSDKSIERLKVLLRSVRRRTKRTSLNADHSASDETA